MVEILEYALVVLLSTVVAAFSLGVYGGYASAVRRSTDEAAFASVVELAHSAIEHGVATSSISIEDAKIACVSDGLSFVSPWFSGKSSLPVPCAFLPVEFTGTKELTFNYSAEALTLQVK